MTTPNAEKVTERTCGNCETIRCPQRNNILWVQTLVALGQCCRSWTPKQPAPNCLTVDKLIERVCQLERENAKLNTTAQDVTGVLDIIATIESAKTLLWKADNAVEDLCVTKGDDYDKVMDDLIDAKDSCDAAIAKIKDIQANEPEEPIAPKVGMDSSLNIGI